MNKLERAVMQQALEALEHAAECVKTNYLPDRFGHDWDEQITALREALAEQALQNLSDFHQMVEKQAEQEPVALMEVFSGWDDVAIIDVLTDSASKLSDGEYKLYTTPVRTKDLTDDEIAELFGNEENWTCDRWSYERAVIAAFKEKNK